MKKIIIVTYLATSCLCLSQDTESWFSISEQAISDVETSLDSYKNTVKASLENNQWILGPAYFQSAIDLYNSLPRSENDTLALVRAIPDDFKEISPLPAMVVAYEKSLNRQHVENYLKMRELIGYMNPNQQGSFLSTISAKGTPQVIDLIIGNGIEELFRERVGESVKITDLNNWTTSNTWNNPLYRELGLKYITPIFADSASRIAFLDPYLSETDSLLLSELIDQYIAIGNTNVKAKLLTLAQNATTLGHTEIATKATEEAAKSIETFLANRKSKGVSNCLLNKK